MIPIETPVIYTDPGQVIPPHTLLSYLPHGYVMPQAIEEVFKCLLFYKKNGTFIVGPRHYELTKSLVLRGSKVVDLVAVGNNSEWGAPYFRYKGKKEILVPFDGSLETYTPDEQGIIAYFSLGASRKEYQ
jgi:hypothetical protein